MDEPFKIDKLKYNIIRKLGYIVIYPDYYTLDSRRYIKIYSNNFESIILESTRQEDVIYIRFDDYSFFDTLWQLNTEP